MRLSVRNSDPGYSADAFRACVFLDGAELRHCFTADEEAHEAHCYVTDANGQLIVDGDRLREEVKRGRVEIVVLPEGDVR